MIAFKQSFDINSIDITPPTQEICNK